MTLDEAVAMARMALEADHPALTFENAQTAFALIERAVQASTEAERIHHQYERMAVEHRSHLGFVHGCPWCDNLRAAWSMR